MDKLLYTRGDYELYMLDESYNLASQDLLINFEVRNKETGKVEARAMSEYEACTYIETMYKNMTAWREHYKSLTSAKDSGIVVPTEADIIKLK